MKVKYGNLLGLISKALRLMMKPRTVYQGMVFDVDVLSVPGDRVSSPKITKKAWKVPQLSITRTPHLPRCRPCEMPYLGLPTENVHNHTPAQNEVSSKNEKTTSTARKTTNANNLLSNDWTRKQRNEIPMNFTMEWWVARHRMEFLLLVGLKVGH